MIKATVTKIGRGWYATFTNEDNYEENIPIHLNLSEEFLGKSIGIIIEDNKVMSIQPWK